MRFYFVYYLFLAFYHDQLIKSQIKICMMLETDITMFFFLIAEKLTTFLNKIYSFYIALRISLRSQRDKCLLGENGHFSMNPYRHLHLDIYKFRFCHP